jgi:peptidoglycan-associated lipoprotein
MMNSTTVKSILLALIGMLIVSGCATTQVAEETAPQQSTEMASTTPQATPEEKAVEEVPPPAPAVQVKFDRVYFGYDQSTLSEQARAALSNNAVILQTTPELKVSIEGHCDDRGSDEYNLALGERRAQAVRNFLVSLGVAPERMETISYGEEMPVDSNSNEIAWAKNRRAEFKKLN